MTNPHPDLETTGAPVAADGAATPYSFGQSAHLTAEKSAREATRSTGIDATFTALRGACTPMYADRAQRLFQEKRFLSAKIYAAASLLFNPTHGRSPYYRAWAPNALRECSAPGWPRTGRQG